MVQDARRHLVWRHLRRVEDEIIRLVGVDKRVMLACLAEWPVATDDLPAFSDLQWRERLVALFLTNEPARDKLTHALERVSIALTLESAVNATVNGSKS